MNVSLLRIKNTRIWDFRPDLAQNYAAALKNAIELHLGNDIEKLHGYFLSRKGYQKDGRTVGANFEDKLYVGNIYRVENHLYWNDEELQDDDEIINVVVVDGPVTRDGDGCSYGTKDFRDQVMYANTIPQVVGHLFVINTPGGQSSCRNDYDMMIADCREKGKPTVAFVDGMCCSSGVNLACRCDRVIVMNPKDEFGCIGSMAAFWAVAHDTVSDDGYRYVELVGDQCQDKNAWYREAAKGEYEKLQEELNKDTADFHQTVRENRPLVTEEMLTGKVFEAAEVIPALVDEIGDMERAIEAVFELAGEQLQPARFMTAEPKEDDGQGEGHEEPEELAKLNGQQKAAMAKDAKNGGLVMAEDGHVTEERQGFFGPQTVEVATPKNENNMTQEELKAQEAQEAQAAQEQALQQEAAGEGAGEQSGEQAGEGTLQQEGAGEGAGEGAQEGAQEGAGEGAGEGTGEEAGEGAGEGAGEDNGEGAGEGTQEGAGEGAGEDNDEVDEQGAQEGAGEQAIENAQEDIDKIQETLHTAEATIAERDKTIADLTEQLESARKDRGMAGDAIVERDHDIESLKKSQEQLQADIEKANGTISEKDAVIEKLQKQVEDLKAEVKELTSKEEPLAGADAGIPAGNGTGDAPKASQHQRITRDMSYEEIREACKQGK